MRNNISFFNDTLSELTGKVLAPGASYTTIYILQLGKSENQGIDWDLTCTGSPNLNIQLKQSNNQLGPFYLWSTPSAAGSTVVNQLNVTTKNDGSDIQLAPSGYAVVYVKNNAGAALTINRMSLVNQ